MCRRKTVVLGEKPAEASLDWKPSAPKSWDRGLNAGLIGCKPKTWHNPMRSDCTCYNCAWGFHSAYAKQRFLANNFSDFLDVGIKKITFCCCWHFVTANSTGFKIMLNGSYLRTHLSCRCRRTYMCDSWLFVWGVASCFLIICLCLIFMYSLRTMKLIWVCWKGEWC